MTKDDIIKMAAQAGAYWDYADWNMPQAVVFNREDYLIQFAQLVAAHEREACAKVAEAYEPRCDTCPSGVANAIRARGVNHGQD